MLKQFRADVPLISLPEEIKGLENIEHSESNGQEQRNEINGPIG